MVGLKIKMDRWDKYKLRDNKWFCQRCSKEQDSLTRHEIFLKGFTKEIIVICDSCYKEALFDKTTEQ